MFESYFTEFTLQKAIFYAILVIYVCSVALVSMVEPSLRHYLHCDFVAPSRSYLNSMFEYDPCNYERYALLLFLTPNECSFARRLVIAVGLGGLIGWERREADRPAGIRTMSLVSLGSCLFTINSTFAFLDGPMAWDASRISAAIPSGVGFLGAGLIFKQGEKDSEGQTMHVVHGLTTAASLWLSAAVGVACGGELYFSAGFCTACMLVLLRFGPRGRSDSDEDEQNGINDVPADSSQYSSIRNVSIKIPEGTGDDQSETSSLLAGRKSS
eukprot:CAMPEP_0194250390 /NCGR_PEP_ID=MMETSP0158-20130606/22912_1 /TAXON_ID=33649 /ORGANISM="Thalassionema nitzschioides, Strain L26-B" /LENGTH=269 /DNA_ID=CAMNT_0038987185 /DNA_START=111 /DNA_END=917 /DNA_ORIENTATION=+